MLAAHHVRQQIVEPPALGAGRDPRVIARTMTDRKSTRLNSSHTVISYAAFCLKKKKSQVTLGSGGEDNNQAGKEYSNDYIGEGQEAPKMAIGSSFPALQLVRILEQHAQRL